MTAIAWSDVIDAAPQLTDAVILPARQTKILAYAEEKFDPTKFRGEDSATYFELRVMFAAHVGEMDRRRGLAGAVQSETVAADSISFSYGRASAFDSLLASTPYGERVLEMVRSSPGSRMPVTWGPSW